MQYRSYHEGVIITLIVLLTLLLHVIILSMLFIFTRRQDNEPLRLTPQHKVVEYLLDSLAQASTPTPSNTSKQSPKEEPEEDKDHYTLQHAISYGSNAQGSIVAPGEESTGKNKQDNMPQPQHKEANRAKQQEEPEFNHTNPVQPQPEPHELNQPTTPPNVYDALQSMVDNSGTSWVSQKSAQQQTPSPKPSTSTSQKTENTGQAAPKKQLTLADITQSYIKQVRKEQESTSNYTYNPTGHNTTARHGAYAPPTDGIALAEQIYASKLYNLLEQSAMAYSSQIYSCRDLEMETVIEVTIEKSGKILDVALKPEIPEKDMQNALCLIVKRVGLFPPIPKQFHKQRIILSIPIRIRSKQGFASYRLLYGMQTA
jgi:hypothetical protein